MAETERKTHLTLCLTRHHRRKCTHVSEVKVPHNPQNIFMWVYISETSCNLTANFYKYSYTKDRIHQYGFLFE